MKRYVLDTNIFEFIINDKFDISSIMDKVEFFTTHIQQDELNNTKDKQKKQRLLKVFKQIHPVKKKAPNTDNEQNESVKGKVATESMVWDFSDWDDSKWTKSTPEETENEVATNSFILGCSKLSKAKLGNADLYSLLLKHLDKDKPTRHKQNIRDALIGETAMKNGFILITDDDSLRQNVLKLKGKSINFDEFKKEFQIKSVK